jgi:hypothetical protein
VATPLKMRRAITSRTATALLHRTQTQPLLGAKLYRLALPQFAVPLPSLSGHQRTLPSRRRSRSVAGPEGVRACQVMCLAMFLRLVSAKLRYTQAAYEVRAPLVPPQAQARRKPRPRAAPRSSPKLRRAHRATPQGGQSRPSCERSAIERLSESRPRPIRSRCTQKISSRARAHPRPHRKPRVRTVPWCPHRRRHV